ncbi:DNA adenine methylase [Campylobacter coli]|nr:DNA adenine methylase [Campylobacter coli]EHP2222558.1 DNA adenine methylase [Campylobacter jejuni]EFT8732997.1 DNA adenine methylase [Campylobacter coli]EFT8767308.1 DNA adenine methylase [Campylobacter coli]EFT9687346.1 DNA adenine methylase [Campylobacter coli]
MDFINPPFNYTGSKFKLLRSILPLFPKTINTIIDLFCGGGSVGININAKKIILNDKQSELIDIFRLFQKQNYENLLDSIFFIIDKFNLSKSDILGYEYYNCNSANGLSSYNKAGFAKLKESYNKNKNQLELFVLLIFSFNNQMRFNSKGDFNLPCGKRDFNKNMQEKLKKFINALQNKNIEFSSLDFVDFDISNIKCDDFVYIDPPYLLSCASYNENGLWSESIELMLYDFMQKLDSKNIKFAFSNVLFHKGVDHTLLQKWLDSNPHLKVHNLDFHYKNCNYQTKRTESKEVLITNY